MDSMLRPARPALAAVDAPTDARANASAWIPGVVSGVLMLGAGLIGATRAVLSWDEVTTADVAGRSAAQIWALSGNVDAVFGPYYFLMHFWTAAFGDSVLMLRLPTIIAMAAAAGVAAELGRRLFSPLVGTVAGLILCLVPNTSRYAAEARPYAFACFFSILALLLLFRAVERPGRSAWAGYGVAVVFVGLSHVIALTTLGAHLAVVCRSRRRGHVLPVWAAVAGAAVLILAPVVVLGMTQQHRQVSWIAPLTWHGLRSAPAQIAGSTPVAWLLAGLALAAARRPGRYLVPVAAMALVPLGAVAVASVLSSPLWVPRYLLVVLAPTAILAAVATAGRLPVRKTGVAVRVVVVLAVLTFVAWPGQRAVRGATYKSGSDYRSAAGIIRRAERPGDGIVYTPHNRSLRAGIDYYLRSDPARPRDVTERRPAAAAAGLIALEYPDAARRAAGLAGVWLFVYGDHRDPLSLRPDLAPLLRTGYRRIGVWHVNRATLALFRRPPS